MKITASKKKFSIKFRFKKRLKKNNKVLVGLLRTVVLVRASLHFLVIAIASYTEKECLKFKATARPNSYQGNTSSTSFISLCVA